MKIWFQSFALAQLALLLLVASAPDSYAQTWGDRMYYNGMQQMMWGGQLPSATASGKAILDSVTSLGMMDTSRNHLLYFIDSSGNGLKKYQLFFGPYWYNPASGAQRPQNGQSITVRGGLVFGNGSSYDVGIPDQRSGLAGFNRRSALGRPLGQEIFHG